MILNSDQTQNLHAPSDVRDDYLDGPVAAEVERLVAKMDAIQNGNESRKLMITSALMGEGKSTLACHLARSAARNKSKPTLLIDFDIRRPSLHKMFGVKKEHGVADILKDNHPFAGFFKDTLVPNLFLLTSGIIESSPIDILRWDRIKIFLDEVQRHFCTVIVDAPPVIPVSDALGLGRLVDNVVLIIKAGETPRHIAKRAIDMLHDVKVKIDGIILNDMESVLPSYYHPDYYGYEYFESSYRKPDFPE